ncbi:hypothetical protein M885DRAFT_552281 [Pelagophyceae sp. CCMP2097]|nr:hypothetical protein M885DRAFT_552281 [Pelagophyceae sp. CCMP2097]
MRGRRPVPRTPEASDGSPVPRSPEASDAQWPRTHHGAPGTARCAQRCGQAPGRR